MKTILITGINGYLGSQLANILTANFNIIGLEYSLDNLFRIDGKGYKVYSVEEGMPERVFIEQHIDIVLHAATFYGRQGEDIATIANANLFSPFKLLDQAIENKCSLFINTDTVLDRFVSSYALTKNQFHDWLYFRRNEIKVINMQLEHFYGPNAANTNFITAMVDKMTANVHSIDLTAGEQLRDFIHVNDVLSAYEKVIVNSDRIEEPYTNFQVANGQLISIKELLLLIRTLTISSSILNFGALPYRENELMKSETNNSALKKLGWLPRINIEHGIKTLINKSN